MNGFLRSLIFVIALVVASPAVAVNPDEILSDPRLEERARDISANLRCLVCQNQSIDDSDAQLARDLRVLVRDRIEAGDTDKQVIDYVVDRYGEFVLLRPQFSGRNLLLWGTPILVFVLGGALALGYNRRNNKSAVVAPLTGDEEMRLREVLGENADSNGQS